MVIIIIHFSMVDMLLGFIILIIYLGWSRMNYINQQLQSPRSLPENDGFT
jgi:hypothetical protein